MAACQTPCPAPSSSAQSRAIRRPIHRYGSALPFPAPRCIPQRLLSSSDLDRPLLNPRYSVSSGGCVSSLVIYSRSVTFTLSTLWSLNPLLVWERTYPSLPLSLYDCTTERLRAEHQKRTSRSDTRHHTRQHHLVRPPSFPQLVCHVVSSFGRKAVGLVGAQSSSDEAGRAWVCSSAGSSTCSSSCLLPLSFCPSFLLVNTSTGLGISFLVG